MSDKNTTGVRGRGKAHVLAALIDVLNGNTTLDGTDSETVLGHEVCDGASLEFER